MTDKKEKKNVGVMPEGCAAEDAEMLEIEKALEEAESMYSLAIDEQANALIKLRTYLDILRYAQKCNDLETFINGLAQGLKAEYKYFKDERQLVIFSED